jgi:hypothetical protein
MHVAMNSQMPLPESQVADDDLLEFAAESPDTDDSSALPPGWS